MKCFLGDYNGIFKKNLSGSDHYRRPQLGPGRIFDFNLVAFLFGSMSILSRIIYMLVGLSALVVAYSAATCCRTEEHFVKEISK